MITDEQVPDERLNELIAYFDAHCISAAGRSLAERARSLHAATAIREFLSLRAKHDKIMEALREAGPNLDRLVAELTLRAQLTNDRESFEQFTVDASQLRALAKLSEGE